MTTRLAHWSNLPGRFKVRVHGTAVAAFDATSAYDAACQMAAKLRNGDTIKKRYSARTLNAVVFEGKGLTGRLYEITQI